VLASLGAARIPLRVRLRKCAGATGARRMREAAGRCWATKRSGTPLARIRGISKE